MTSKLTIAKVGGGVIDLTANTGMKGSPYFDGDTSLIELGMRFASGEAAQGTFKVLDPEAEIARADFTYNLPAHKIITWTEDAPGAEIWLFRGRTSSYDGGRGHALTDNFVEFDVTADDINRDLRYQAFTEAWVRPAETDVARIIALGAYTLNGAASTATNHGDTYDITISSSHLAPNSNTVSMPAKTYPVGTQPQDVVQDCADTAGKFYGVVPHHVGGSHACLLYILPADHATYVSAIKISDNLADWDPEDLTAPVYEPHWEAGKATLYDGQQLLSGLVSIYNSESSVFVQFAQNVTDYDYAVDAYYDPDSVTPAQAAIKAEGILSERRLTHVTHRVSIIMLPEQVDLVTVGMSLEIKAAAAIAGQYLDIYQTRRVAQCTFEPRLDGRYWVHLELDRATTRRGASGGAIQPPRPPPVCTPDTPGTTIATWNWAVGDPNGTLDLETGTFLFGLSWSPSLGGHGYNTASHRSATMPSVTPGTAYTFSFEVWWSPPGNFTDQDVVVEWKAGAVLLQTDLLIASDGIPANAHQFPSVTFTAPVGATTAEVWCAASGLKTNIDNFTFGTGGTVADNDPNCVPAALGSSPYFVPSDAAILTSDNAHLTSRVAQRVTNNSGVTLNAGDVVIPDITIDGPAVTRTTAASSTAGPIGVVSVGGADDAEVRVVWSGAAAFINTNGTPADGDYLYTSTTAGVANVSVTRTTGAFGRVVRDDGAGETLYVLLWGVPDPTGAVTDHGGLTGLADDDHPQYLLDSAVQTVGHYEVVVSGTAPPVAVTNMAEDDWVYGWVS